MSMPEGGFYLFPDFGPRAEILAARGIANSVQLSRRALKDAFRLLYRSNLNVSQAVERIRAEHAACDEVDHLLRFIEASNRGIVR